MWKYCRTLIINFTLLFIIVACIHNEGTFENDTPELVFQASNSKAIYKGIAQIYSSNTEEDIIARFSPTDPSKIYVLSRIDNSEPSISELDYKTMKSRTILYEKDYFPKNRLGYPTTKDFQFTDISTMTYFLEDTYQNKIFSIHLDTMKGDYVINRCGIKSSPYSPLRYLSVMIRNSSELVVSDIKNDPCEITYKYIDSSRIGRTDQIFWIDLGRNRDELIYCSSNLGLKSIFDREEKKVIFYNIKEDRIEKIIVLPVNAKNSQNNKFTWGNPYILPNLEEILFIGGGLWLLNIKTEELICLVWWNDSYMPMFQPRLMDISWDSKRIMFIKMDSRLEQKLFVLYIEEYLKYQPNGQEIFF